jgi:squalene-associated FAD-dependent desaturase
MTGSRVVVVGGGLAGITAAIELREAGHEVTLLEARPRLGGAASSYQRGDLTIDNGQHVILRCCEAYRGLLGKLGVAGLVAFQPRFDVTVLAPGGRVARLRRSGLPSPLHMTGSLLRYGMLPMRQRLAVAKAALAMRFLDAGDARLDESALGQWLVAHGQGELARRALWDLFIVSALNIAGDDASLQLAAIVIKTALLGAKDAADVGVATVPLGELHGTATAARLTGLGARVLMSAKVASVRPAAAGGFDVELGPDGHDGPDERDGPGGRSFAADGVVLAVPPAQASKLAAEAGVAGARRWEGLGASPIVNVHVIYDRQVTDEPFVAAVDSPLQWVFDKTQVAGLNAGQYLAVSLSAADRYVGVPSAQLRDEFLAELARLFPAAANAQVVDSFVTRERRATFRQAPGCGALRPGAATSVSGLVLAGSWTDTGWPDTMEGAVRSGHCAAQQLMRELTPDYPRSGSPRSGSPRSGSPRSGSPRSGSPRSGSPRSGSPRSGSPRSGSPRSGSPKLDYPISGNAVSDNPGSGYPRSDSPSPTEVAS